MKYRRWQMYCAQRQRHKKKEAKARLLDNINLLAELNIRSSARSHEDSLPRRESLIYNGATVGVKDENSPDLQDATAKSQKCNWKREGRRKERKRRKPRQTMEKILSSLLPFPLGKAFPTPQASSLLLVRQE